MGWAILMLVIGLVLLLAEVFVAPSGTFFILAMAALIVGVVMVFYAPEESGGGTLTGVIALGSLFIIVPVIIGAALHYMPRTLVGKKFFLPEPGDDTSLAATPEFVEREQLKGQIGKTVTPHQPSGVTLIQGQRFDTKTEGLFLDVDQWVRVVDVRSGQVTVRPLDAIELRSLPDDLTS